MNIADASVFQPAFASGTRLLTPNGYVCIDAFKAGDPVISRLGIRRAVKAVGLHRVEIGLSANRDAAPVRLLPGAFGPGLPGRAVRLAPAHAVFVEDVPVPVLQLVNGATIQRENTSGPVTYFRLELDRPDMLMSEGLPVASGDNTTSCIGFGPKLSRIRRRLHEIASHAGFTLGQAPCLQGVVGSRVLQADLRPEGAGWVAHFDLPPNTERLVLLARSAAPAETNPDATDRRQLSICLRPRAKRDFPVLGEGWYARAPGDPGTWMRGSGEILLPPGTAGLTLQLSAIAQSWQLTPAVDLRPPAF